MEENATFHQGSQCNRKAGRRGEGQQPLSPLSSGPMCTEGQPAPTFSACHLAWGPDRKSTSAAIQLAMETTGEIKPRQDLSSLGAIHQLMQMDHCLDGMSSGDLLDGGSPRGPGREGGSQKGRGSSIQRT